LLLVLVVKFAVLGKVLVRKAPDILTNVDKKTKWFTFVANYAELYRYISLLTIIKF